jgi:hypothetical protein
VRNTGGTFSTGPTFHSLATSMHLARTVSWVTLPPSRYTLSLYVCFSPPRRTLSGRDGVVRRSTTSTHQKQNLMRAAALKKTKKKNQNQEHIFVHSFGSRAQLLRLLRHRQSGTPALHPGDSLPYVGPHALRSSRRATSAGKTKPLHSPTPTPTPLHSSITREHKPITRDGCYGERRLRLRCGRRGCRGGGGGRRRRRAYRRFVSPRGAGRGAPRA